MTTKPVVAMRDLKDSGLIRPELLSGPCEEELVDSFR